MKTVLTAVVLCTCAGVLFAAAVLTLVIQFLPYLAIGCALVLLAKAARRHEQASIRQVMNWQASSLAPRHVAPVGQWVYVPVWVETPRHPALPVIDAEVVEEGQ